MAKTKLSNRMQGNKGKFCLTVGKSVRKSAPANGGVKLPRIKLRRKKRLIKIVITISFKYQ
jgi:hypothetical protein